MKPIDRIKFFIIDAAIFLALLATIAFIPFVWYGLETQCPGVAIYQFCGK